MRQDAAFKLDAQLLLEMARQLLLWPCAGAAGRSPDVGRGSGTVGVFVAHGGSMECAWVGGQVTGMALAEQQHAVQSVLD